MESKALTVGESEVTALSAKPYRASAYTEEKILNLGEAQRHYVAHLFQRGKAHNTVVAADRTLDAFRASLPTVWDWGTVPLEGNYLTVAHIENFLYEGGFGPATFNRYRSVLNGFFSWLQKQGEIQSNPVATVEAMPPSQPKPKLILSPAEMLRMLDNSNPVERIALALGMNTGLRASDIVSLAVGDVDLASGYVATTIQKTRGLDRKPITAELERELRRWLDAYSFSLFADAGGEVPNGFLLVPSYTVVPTLKPGGSAPFTNLTTSIVTRPQQKLTHPHRIVQRALAREGFATAGEGFHTLRRSSARALFEQLRVTENADHALMVVKEFLNHRSTAQTEVYLGINHERAVRDEMLRGKSFLSAQPLAPNGPTPAVRAAAEFRDWRKAAE